MNLFDWAAVWIGRAILLVIAYALVVWISWGAWQLVLLVWDLITWLWAGFCSVTWRLIQRSL